MRVEVDLTTCLGNAQCVALAPAVFAIEQHDVVELLDRAPAEELRPALERAARLCPTQSITIEG